MKTYPESVRFLYSLGNEVKTIKPGLERISALLEALGHPERAMRHIHVAGTNGKGSTCAMIEAALRVAGRRTGLYTSPHLVEPTERIQVGGKQVTREQFTWAFQKVHQVAMQMEDHSTYFETVTAMGFLLFRELGVEIAVVEVGMGGRLDATNVITPVLSVVTPVDFDHETWLGKSLRAIAGEKAGILKPGVPAVIAPQKAEAQERLRESIAGPVEWVSDWETREVELHRWGSRFVAARGERAIRVECNLAGEHQVTNALTAVAALEAFGVDAAGIGEAKWPGRLERVARDPDIIVDGAHNPAGVRALAAYIRRFFGDRRVWLIYATMRDKSVDEIGDLLSPVASEIILTQVDSARALRPEALRELFDHPRVRTSAGLKQALEMARGEASREDVIFITGSLFLVGEALGPASCA